MTNDRTEILRQAFIYGLAKGIKGDDEDIDTTCPCCDRPRNFEDLDKPDEVRRLLELHQEAEPEVIANILTDYFAKELLSYPVPEAIIIGFVIGEEVIDDARILDLREDES